MKLGMATYTLLFMWDFCYVKFDRWNSTSNPFNSRSWIKEGNHFLSNRVPRFQVKRTIWLNDQRRIKLYQNKQMYLQGWNESNKVNENEIQIELKYKNWDENKLWAMIFTHKFHVAPCVLGHKHLRCNMSVLSCLTKWAELLFIDKFQRNS